MKMEVETVNNLLLIISKNENEDEPLVIKYGVQRLEMSGNTLKVFIGGNSKVEFPKNISNENGGKNAKIS